MDHMQEVEKLRARTDIHFNCAQSLLVPFRDVTGLSEDESYRLGRLFGSGMHHGGLCGTLSSAAMILGMAGFGKDVSTAMIRDFRKRHESIQCRDLLAASAKRGIPRKPHCDGLVFEMTRFLDETLAGSTIAQQDRPTV
jgi:C_GCAxxG_C_C family probable redox protein